MAGPKAEWNSADYLKFSSERTQPAIDLAARVPLRHPARVVDIGCGPGNSTAVLRRRFPEAAILGVDNSENMVEAAKKEHPDLAFALCDVTGELPFPPASFDLCFSNACLQWVPGHPGLLRRLMGLLRPGGVLAVQIPMNQEEPIHRIIGRLAAGEKWGPKFPQPRIFYSLTPEGYYDLLTQISSSFELWQTTYFHKMPSHAAILDWYRSTGLRPYLSALPEAERPEFERDVYEEVVRAYPARQNGDVIFRFPRFFFLAVK